eukprot:TRINITY_DN14301_c0_g1_i3.p1 TRINITY_DN14301_c0_g1~~TRINITY_DN14301_c0_g1_i3.p1  ORF type:complete len:563 (+),score=100.94 TRINITY_DN14301_c0_g1_i3:88-1689(+)
MESENVGHGSLVRTSEQNDSGEVSTANISMALLVGIICTAVIFGVHKTKKQPTEASHLMASLWGIDFKPFTMMKKVLMASFGVLGLLALVVHTVITLGPFASSTVVAIVLVTFKHHGLLPDWKSFGSVLRKSNKATPHAVPRSRPGEPNAPPLPVWILTGFLGSGKTTLVNRLVGRGKDQPRFLVIENEVGDTTLDAELVIQAAGSKENVLLVNDGCACCKVRGDLCDLLRDEVLAERVPRGGVDGVIIECSGLSDPRAVVQTFLVDTDLKQRLELREVVALVDAAHVGRHLLHSHAGDKRQEKLTRLVEEQIAFASILVINKLDRLANREKDLEAVLPAVKAINRTAEILESTFCNIDLSLVLGGAFPSAGATVSSSRWPTSGADRRWLRRGAWSPSRALLEIESVHLAVPPGDREDDDKVPSFESTFAAADAIRCVSVRIDGELDLDAFNRWVLRILQDFDVLRAKGVLAAAGFDEKLAFQCVHAAFDGTPSLTAKWRPGEQRSSEVIVIGCDLRPDLIEYGLRRCRVKAA